jgi:peroxiredoxin/mono/diheme cytochrome c family protein
MPPAPLARVRPYALAVLAALLLSHPVTAQQGPAAAGLGKKIDNFTLKDAAGKPWSLGDARDRKATVVVFLSFECPVSNSYAQPLAELYAAYRERGVAVVGVCPRDEGDAAKIAQLARDYKLPFPVFRDGAPDAARALQAAVTPEAFVLDAAGVLRYRGRIDDGYAARLKKNQKVTREDLRLALDDLLAGRPVRQPATQAVGCPILPDLSVREPINAKVTYHRDVLPILQKHCQQCHRPGGVAPFALMNYRQAVTWAGDIKDYTRARKMPPWKPVEGPDFHNERRLSDREIETLAAWVDAKSPEGDTKDAPPPVKFAEGWQLGKPDLILTPDDDFHLGATGPDHFRCFVLPVKLDEDKYLTAVEVRPGNPRVVHHAVLLLDRSGTARKYAEEERKKKPGLDRGPGYYSAMASELLTNFLAGPWPLLGVWAPGQVPQHVPDGLGYYVPKGSDLVLQVHYSRSGRPEKDRTSIGLYFSKKPKARAIEGIFLSKFMKPIPAGEERCRVAMQMWVDRDCTLYSAFPHMHLIGKEVTVTMTPPGGKARTLIRINDWDFNWQETYYFKKPIHVPAGTRFDVEAFYDNSSKNPNNPNNPPRIVNPGLETNNEMLAVLLEATSERPGRIWPRSTPPDAPKPKEPEKK